MNPRGCDTTRAEGSTNLTPREREVARLIASGHSSKQIAADLGISFRTVVSHRFRIFQKLSVTNTAELVAQAVRMGLVGFLSGSSVPPDSDQPLSYRMTAMRKENARERQLLAALLLESRLLREQSAPKLQRMCVATLREYMREAQNNCSRAARKSRPES